MSLQNQKYSCVLVDDEKPARDLLEAYIEKLPYLELTKSCSSAMEAIGVIHQQSVDILILDIQMPSITGLELVKALKKLPQVIITTAYRQYALEGFELNVSDFLLKPFSLNRFVAALDKCIDKINLNQIASKINVSQEPAVDHIYVRTNHKMQKVKFDDIIYIESMKEYVSLHTLNGRYVVNMSMLMMLKQLPTLNFQRVHRSFIINKNHIISIKGNEIVLGEKTILIGGSYREAFFKTIHSI